MPSPDIRVTYADMLNDARLRAENADDLLREYQKLEDNLEPVDAAHVERAARQKAIAVAEANLIAFCERNKELVRKRLEEERKEEDEAVAAAERERAGEAA